MSRALFTTSVIFLLVLSLAGTVPARAQNDHRENVEEIMEGFEEEAPARTDGELEELMQGFEADSPVKTEPSPEGDDILQGFEEEDGEKAANSRPTPQDGQPSSWSLDGEFVFTTTYNFSPDAVSPWRDFTMLRPELELTLQNRFSGNWQGQISAKGFYDLIYGLRGRDEYTAQVIDEYEKELELEDTFIQGRLTESLDTKIGRQIVVWGTLDNLRVTDVLNPLDLRLPGLTDIDDLRLPVTMVKFDYYPGNWNLSGIVLPEVRFSKLPVFGSDFYPFPQPRPPEQDPDEGFDHLQYAAALTGVFSGWDVGFYWADIYDDRSTAELVSPGPPEQFVRRHARINMLGTAANLALGNWLLKAEVAVFRGLQYTNTPGVEYNRLDLGGGVEYSGFSEATISLEAVNRHIFDYDAQLELPPDEIDKDEFQWALRIAKDLLNDTLTLTLLASTFGIKADDGAFERFDAAYDLTDGVTVRGGVVLYQSGDKGRFKDAGANDRLFLVFKTSF
jgi:hypothetical protein